MTVPGNRGYQGWANSPETVSSIYSPLDTNKVQIRVAILKPRQSTDSHIQVQLQTVSLRDDTHFNALSWAWGDASDVRPILLDNQLWWTPKNLVVALEHLVCADSECTIWIDALCINQSQTPAGLTERSHQIGLMRHIYTFANSVIVWMGTERAYTEGVLSFLSEVAENSERPQDAPPTLPRSFHVAYNNSWKVQHLLAEPWWQRLWVLQEVGLAKKSVLRYGKTTMPFDKALFAINMLEMRGHLFNSPGHFEAKLGPFMNPELYGFMFKDRYRNPTVMAFTPRKQHFVTFATLLITCRFRSATDPRDKIYGLFGLVPDLVLQALQPRYDESPEKLYIRTAFTLMGEEQSLSLLSHTTPWLRGKQGLENLPSWVPDWTIKNEIEYWSELPNHMSDNPSHKISLLGNKIQLSVQDGRHLRLQGVLIDTVLKKNHGYHGFWRFLDWSKHRRMLSKVCNDEPTEVLENDLEFMKENRWTAFWEIFSLAYIGAILDIASFKLFAFMRWVDHLSHEFHYYLFPQSDKSSEILKECEERDFAVMQTSRHMKICLKDQPELPTPSTIFTTVDGFVGIGPAFMERGDSIFVVAGARYPLILRPSHAGRSRYSYVGECYLAGIMQGEATSEGFGSWRRRKSKIIPDNERQLNDGDGIWEEVILE